jgi:DNA-binding MltR family transcriptional regulator
MRKPVDAEDITKALEELQTDGPRGVAVLASAFLEDVLRLAILAKMRKLTEDEEDRLFVGLGPLATLSTKIQIGYALSIYGPKTRHDLDSFREIRNALAHVRSPIDFNTTEIIERCRGFHCLKALDAPAALDARAQFTIAARVLMIRLMASWQTGPTPSIPPEVRLLD